MQFLNQFQNGTAVSGDKIVENQKKSYDYEITGLAAERVETHMKRFLEEGEKSLYQEGEDAGKQLTKEMESFVSDYNMMIRKIGDLSDLSLIHISEPTRQAEISYAVFCLKKKKKKRHKAK